MKPADIPIPSSSQIFVGGNADNFEAIGEKWRTFFVEELGLSPNASVLDVGCGIGRLARPLTAYLEQGQYRGFDIVREGIDWCEANISSVCPNFRFTHADTYNQHYNPDGRTKDQEYVFPYEDGQFDLVYLTSVFTHMLPAGFSNYLSEIARVLRPGGQCAITYFLYDGTADGPVRSRDGRMDFATEFEPHCRVVNPNDPEAALAYEESFIRGQYEGLGLAMERPVIHGAWHTRGERSRFFQDVVVARKR